MNSKRLQILQTLNNFTVRNNEEINEFLFTTSFGFVFGKLSNDTAQNSNNKSLNLGFALSGLDLDSEKEKQIQNDDYVLLKDVMLVTSLGKAFLFDSYILFCDAIIGVSLVDVNHRYNLK